MIAPATEKSKFIKGYLYALATVFIWSGWIIISRLGTTHSLTPFDITFFRYAPAGILMLPISWKYRHIINRKNWRGLAIMLLGAGPIYLMLVTSGFALAPASHGVLTPCSMTLFVAVITYFTLRERITQLRFLGYALIFSGVIFKFTVSHGSVADFYFLSAGLFWALYTAQNKKSALPPVAVTAFITTLSMLLLLIPYGAYLYVYPHPMPLHSVLQQTIYQGIITAIISFITYNRAIALIGAARASCFAALIPVLVILFAIPILNEKPDNHDLIFAAFMSSGVFLASGVLRLAENKELEDA